MSLQRVIVTVLLCLLAVTWGPGGAWAANIDVRLTMSEPVTVATNGTSVPTIALDVGGVAKSASYTGGSGTATLTFRYPVQSGDFDPDGIAASGSITLPQGTTITDAAGNPALLTFAATTLAAAKVQTYNVAWNQTALDASSGSAASFTISGAPAGVSYSYVITSSNSTLASVSGSGVTSSGTTVTSADVSALPVGTLTVAVSLSLTASGGGKVSGVARTAAVPATGLTSGLLDGIASAKTLAYSVRQLRAAYTGPLMRVRRGSDNGQLDIYPTIAGNLDMQSLAGFCGTAACTVVTWYDQTGNGNSVNQPTAATQPDLFTAGQLSTMVNGRVAPDLTSNSFGTTATLTGQTFITAGRITNTPNGVTRRIVNPVETLGGTNAAYFGYGGNAVGTRYVNGVASTVVPVNSVVITSAVLTGPYTAQFSIGNISAAGQSNFYPGRMAEVLIFPGALSQAEREAAENSQASYYGITLAR